MHRSTFEYLKPTDAQLLLMEDVRAAGLAYSTALGFLLPNGCDKRYAVRKLREVAMWANVAITRNADGSPRV